MRFRLDAARAAREGEKLLTDGDGDATQVPVCHARGDSNAMRVFFREVVTAARGKLTSEERKSLPAVLFLQGGPGFECAGPLEASGWLGEMVKEHRVFLMDQRGTGRSDSEIVHPTLNRDASGHPLSYPRHWTDKNTSPAKAWAVHLKNFRADSIVKDAELFRKTVLGEDVKWTLLGQSFGGFCITTYLSFAPEGVKEALLTGGLPPLIDEPASALNAYRKLFERVQTQNRKYFERFPYDVDRLYALYVQLQNEGPRILPGGGLLTVPLVRALGFSNLGTAQGMERLHYIMQYVEIHYADEEIVGAHLPHKFLIEVENSFRHFETNPLYAVLHETIYCNGACAIGAADQVWLERVGEDLYSAFGEPESDDSLRRAFTGECVYSSFFEDIPSLRPFKAIVQELKKDKDWPKVLYDTEQLAKNTVPVACASYVEDMFVDFDLASETAAKIRGARVWSTSEYMHSGIREDGARIVQKLLSFVRDEDPIR